MKLILGFLLGTLTASAYLYTSAAYYFSDYFVSEKITATAELQDTVIALEKLQAQLNQNADLQQVNLCPVLCKTSQYQMLYGGHDNNKVATLSSYIHQYPKTAAKDPEFLLDLLYVEGSMSPIENSGFFNWLREIPREEVTMQWQQRASLTSQLAMAAPRIMMALRDARANTRKVDALSQLRKTCTAKNVDEVENACLRILF